MSIEFKYYAIGRVINVAMQILEFLDRNAGKISEYVERRNSRLKLDIKSKEGPVSDMQYFKWTEDPRRLMYGHCRN